MARRKVPDDKRQRTAQACDLCKRRKQKCDGMNPCSTCAKRTLACTYCPGSSPDSDMTESVKLPRKRRVLTLPTLSMSSEPHEALDPSSVPSMSPPHRLNARPQPLGAAAYVVSPPSSSSDNTLQQPAGLPLATGALASPSISDLHGRDTPDDSKESRDGSSDSGLDEETPVLSSPRMLQDHRGRLLFIGDSATPSYLQLIRMVVEGRVGHSPFTQDPMRHRILDNAASLPPDVCPSHAFLPPDRETSAVLVESFFINTTGLIEVFDKAQFCVDVESCYSHPLHVNASFLCLLYLVYAIGLVLATPAPGSAEETAIRQLRNDRQDWAETFYQRAKHLADPVYGLEDADFWSVQALLLMSVYMLSTSKRNAAYAYYGMASRTAFSLGLHREETLVAEIFGQKMLTARRTLWRTLFVFDHFLSASLGRPTAIYENNCSAESLEPASDPSSDAADDLDAIQAHGLEAAVRSSRIVGAILGKIYSRKKISTRMAREITAMCRDWVRRLHPALHWRRFADVDVALSSPGHGVAVLYANLLFCHAVILLTRPFFLYMMTSLQNARSRREGSPSTRIRPDIERLSRACVVASYHTIFLVDKAQARHLVSQRNPFTLHFLFAAGLVVLTNEFGALFHDDAYEARIESAIAIIRYCAQTDPLADRLLYILSAFRDVVSQTDPPSDGSVPTIWSTPSSTYDPVNTLFGLEEETERSHHRLRAQGPHNRAHHPPPRPNALVPKPETLSSTENTTPSSSLDLDFDTRSGASSSSWGDLISPTDIKPSPFHPLPSAGTSGRANVSPPSAPVPATAPHPELPPGLAGYHHGLDDGLFDINSMWRWHVAATTPTTSAPGASGSAGPVGPAALIPPPAIPFHPHQPTTHAQVPPPSLPVAAAAATMSASDIYSCLDGSLRLDHQQHPQDILTGGGVMEHHMPLYGNANFYPRGAPFK